MKFLIFLVLLSTAALGLQSGAAGQPADDSPAGDWRGPSTCQVRPSACNDEDNLYHFTPITKKPGWFNLSADKIVNGEPQNMGDMECSYDSEKHHVECKMPRGGAIRLDVRGPLMEGTMTREDGTLWRKIDLKKVEGKKP